MKKARRDIAGLPDSTYRKLLEQEQQETGAASLFATDTSEHNSDEEYEMADLTEPLNEEHLLDLSRLIATKSDLMTLGIKGLELPEGIIQPALTNNPTDIQEAAYSVLSEWRKGQEDRVAAFNDLVAALRKCGMKKSQLVAFPQKRHSTNAEAAPPACPRVVLPTNDSSHQQVDTRAASVQPELNSYEMTNLTEPLTDKHLWKLSLWISSPKDLRNLGLKGLKLPANKIDSALANKRGDIHAAAYSVLSPWRKKYEDETVAFRDLVAALRECRMNQYVSQLKSQPRAGPSSAGSRTVTNRESPKTPESEPLLARGQVTTINFIIRVF